MNLNYADRGKWKKFVEDYVIPLRDSADALVEYWNYLKEKIDSVPFNEIETEKDENFKKILIGGVKENGDYSERSLALFYSKFFSAGTSKSFGIKMMDGISRKFGEKVFVELKQKYSEEKK
jgi:hypothetical protein